MTTFSLAPSTDHDRAEQALPLALELVDAVRRKDHTDVRSCVDRADIPALLIVLATLVDDERPVSDLLGWLIKPPRRERGQRRHLKPCGTHAAYTRHKKAQEPPCALCVRAERDYQRNRPDRRPGARAA
ncbi:MAG: hypothetical protein NVSMB60_30270 [Mycobacterium sp.]